MNANVTDKLGTYMLFINMIYFDTCDMFVSLQ